MSRITRLIENIYSVYDLNAKIDLILQDKELRMEQVRKITVVKSTELLYTFFLEIEYETY